MSNGTQKDTKDTPKQTLVKAINAMRAAGKLLHDAGCATADPAVCKRISEAYNILDSFISQWQQALAAADDAEFNRAIPAVKEQAAELKSKEEYIKKIVSEVKTAAEIAGAVAQALVFIAKLP